MLFKQRKLRLWGGIALVVIVILTIVTAPNSNKLMAGSTYSKEPNGYGAWYEYMSDKGVKIERWKKPFKDIISYKEKKPEYNKVTYLQIKPSVSSALNNKSQTYKWIGEGNKLIILGVKAPATKADFVSDRSYNGLRVRIKTTRRREEVTSPILKDKYGATVWREKIKKGEVIYAVSPYIAANSYQGVADNYEFLARLVTNSDSNLILVDEYIHGYKDIETKKKEQQGTLADYLSKTVWFPIGIQILLITLVSVVFSWQRFGQPHTIKENKVDNSLAYIEALAGVLEKAQSTEFVIQTISKDEQLKLQKKLGLGRRLLPTDTLVNQWSEQTQKSGKQLRKLLQISQNQKPISEAELIKRIQQWQQFNR